MDDILQELLKLFNLGFISLESLFIASFIGATIMVGGAELIILVALVKSLSVDAIPKIITVATIGNTLGGMTNYIWGRWIDFEKIQQKISPKAVQLIEKYGSASMLISWFPVIGDALCFGAGVFRCNWISTTFFMAFGKGVRYYLLAIAVI